MSPRLPVIAIFGPTASGKSGVAAALAELTAAQMISADAMQVYRGVPILTNQPLGTTALVGIWPLTHEASVGEYAPLAHAAIDEALVAGTTPIVVGGTGLYFRAALADLEIPPPVEAATRVRLEQLYDQDAGATAYAHLTERDPRAASAIHVNDRRRVVRALELAELGHSLRPATHALWTDGTRHPTLIVGLDVDKDELEKRIRARTAAMLAAGAANEARQALGAPMSKTASRIIGLREAVGLSEDEAIQLISEKTRRYAAYQRKWMRRIPTIRMVSAGSAPEEIAREILEMARAR